MEKSLYLLCMQKNLLRTLLSPEFLVAVDTTHFERTDEGEGMTGYVNKENSDRVSVRGMS